MYGGDTMPKAHDEKVLKDLLVKQVLIKFWQSNYGIV